MNRAKARGDIIFQCNAFQQWKYPSCRRNCIDIQFHSSLFKEPEQLPQNFIKVKCLNNFNKIFVEPFSLLHHHYKKCLKFVALIVSAKRFVNCSGLITQFICVMEIVQLQQSLKGLRILKAGANVNTTRKPHRVWSGFDLVFLFFTYSGLLTSIHKVMDFQLENIPY